ncbi:MAG: adenylate/guanylate cyclase domain-containing protein [Flavisolibacter sp.]|nr:adenylate/guanylate cyclase domain-containing protein [Flavisolibacter sp.]
MLTNVNNEMELEILRSEERRTKLMLSILAVLFCISLFNLLFQSKTLMAVLGDVYIFYIVAFWLLFLITVESFFLFQIKRHVKEQTTLSYSFRVFFAFIEISFPSTLISFLVIVKGNLLFLDSPWYSVYFLMILLSTLHLHFQTSLLVAAMASLQYGIIISIGFHSVQTTNIPLLPPLAYYVRCLALLLAGFGSGFVGDEIKKRINAFLKLDRAKRNIEMSFGQQVSKEVAEALMKQGDQARKLEASIMVVDIRNFSGFAAHHTADEILEYQNKIFSPLIDIVQHCGGTVHQILGDGIMVVFGAPVASPVHTVQAVQSALQIRSAVHKLVQSRKIPPTRIGIGIHCGEVLTGNIGNEQRKQYSISGTPVIVAFRVEQLNKKLNTEILVTETVKTKTDSLTAMIPMGEHYLKGFETPFKIYNII